MHKDISNDKKVEILISALEERYAAIHKIRERVEGTGLWILGILVGIGSWIFQSDTTLTCSQKLIYSVAVFGAYLVMRYAYLQDLDKGFKGQQRAAARLEKVLGFYSPGFFDGTNDSLYPEKWEKTGTDQGEGRFFSTTYTLVAVGVVFLVLAIMFSGHAESFRHGYMYSSFYDLMCP